MTDAFRSLGYMGHDDTLLREGWPVVDSGSGIRWFDNSKKPNFSENELNLLTPIEEQIAMAWLEYELERFGPLTLAGDAYIVNPEAKTVRFEIDMDPLDTQLRKSNPDHYDIVSATQEQNDDITALRERRRREKLNSRNRRLDIVRKLAAKSDVKSEATNPATSSPRNNKSEYNGLNKHRKMSKYVQVSPRAINGVKNDAPWHAYQGNKLRAERRDNRRRCERRTRNRYAEIRTDA